MEPSLPSTSTVFSLKNILEFIYTQQQIISIFLWEELLENMGSFILDQPSTIVNIYFIFKNAVSNFGADEVSQAELIRRKEMKMTLTEMIEFFENEIGVADFNSQTINSEIKNTFQNLVIKSTKLVDITLTDSDETDDDDNVFDKAFENILTKNKKKSKRMENTKFEQSFQLTSNDEKKWLKTPGEEGLYMIDIRITDVRDLRTTSPNDWWQKVNKKMVILAQSSKDPLYISVSNVMKLGLNRLKKIQNVKSGSFSVGKRFMPY